MDFCCGSGHCSLVDLYHEVVGSKAALGDPQSVMHRAEVLQIL